MPEMFVIPTLTQLPAWFIVVAGGLVGSLIDSFLNVVIYRLPRMIKREEADYIAKLCEEPLPHPEAYNLIVSRSTCPPRGHQIEAVENIPVLSWLAP